MGPPILPTQAGFALAVARPSIQIEMYLDLVCPFSSKMFKTVYSEVLGKCSPDICFVINQVPQPWHPQGTYVHEAALAVKAVCPAAYPEYVFQVYKAFDCGKFQDDDTLEKTRVQIYDELLALLGTTDGLKQVDAAAVATKLKLVRAPIADPPSVPRPWYHARAALSTISSHQGTPPHMTSRVPCNYALGVAVRGSCRRARATRARG